MATAPDKPPAGTRRDDAPRPAAAIMEIRRYTAGRRTVPATASPVKLSSNESSFGPSPRAIEAFHAVAGELHRYPDPSQAALRDAIAGVHGLDAANIVCGNGSDELIDLLIRAFVEPGGELLLSENHFEMCPVHGRTQGARIVLAPERDFRADVDALLDSVTERTRMAIIANPNNPTGTYLCGEEMRRLHAGLPPQVLLLIDGAYAEYAVQDDFDPGFSLVAGHSNVVVARTFSKIYGLSALRAGWAYCPPDIVDVLERIRSPFNLNGAALAAAAAAVRDQEFIDNVRRHNARWLKRIGEALAGFGLDVVPSAANFYLIRFRPGNRASAAGAAAFLESRGIIPRAVGTGDSANVLRITVGLDHENQAVLDALAEYME